MLHKVTSALLIALTSTALIAGTAFAANADDSIQPTPTISSLPSAVTETAGHSLKVKFTLANINGQNLTLRRESDKQTVSTATAHNGENTVTLPSTWWKTATSRWTITIGSGNESVSKTFIAHSKRAYTNPSKYFTVSEANTSFANYKPHNLTTRTEGIRATRVAKKLHVSGSKHWVRVNAKFKSKVKSFQRRYNKKHGKKLKTNGIVNYATWRALGFSKSSWYADRYASPTKTTRASSKHQIIEAMIKRAYAYRGRTYIVGASSTPSWGLDCSGLVAQAMYAAGVKGFKNTPMWHSQPGGEWGSRYLFKTSKLKKIAYSDRKRGDLVFYKNSRGIIIHVAIYLGGNKVIDSWPNSVGVRKIKNSHRSNVAGIRRIFN